MTFVTVSQFDIYLQCLSARLAKCHNSVLNVKALLGAFNQERALVVAFSVIVKSSLTALSHRPPPPRHSRVDSSLNLSPGPNPRLSQSVCNTLFKMLNVPHRETV